MNVIAGIQPECPYCGTYMVWSVELIEKLIQADESSDSPFDEAIASAIAIVNGKDKFIEMKDVPFMVWLADDPPSVFIAGWCQKCKRISAPVFPLSQLLKLIEDARKET